MLRRSPFLFALLSTILLAGSREAYSQIAPVGSATEPAAGNEPIRRNNFEPTKAVAAPNKINQPIPLSASERDSALDGIDKHVAEEVAALKTKLKNLLPDELTVLAKTVGWTAEKQNALLQALRSGDPAAVYEAWTQAAPQDTAGAELAARQTDVKRSFSRLEQAVQHHAAFDQDLADLETSLGKIAQSTPAVADVTISINTLKTWADVRKLVDTAVPVSGPIVKLPNGRVTLIYEPGLPVGQAVVLGNGAVMIGNHGKGPVSISMGNAAEALGLPLVSGNPLPDADGAPVISGVLLVNPATSRATISYNVNGNRYEMKPAMAQRLPAPGPWTVEYDRGSTFGMSAYSVTDGSYYFTPTDKGLQLFKQRFDVIVDNSDSSQEFNLLVSGQQMAVPANSTKTISSIYPIVVMYDRGNGAQLVTKVLNFGGTVEVGVNSADNMWDLFPTTEGQREVTKLRLFQ